MTVNNISKLIAKLNYISFLRFLSFSLYNFNVAFYQRRTYISRIMKSSEIISGHESKIKIDDSCLEDEEPTTTTEPLYELRNMHPRDKFAT